MNLDHVPGDREHEPTSAKRNDRRRRHRKCADERREIAISPDALFQHTSEHRHLVTVKKCRLSKQIVTAVRWQPKIIAYSSPASRSRLAISSAARLLPISLQWESNR